jgi:hypothetical protein
VSQETSLWLASGQVIGSCSSDFGGFSNDEETERPAAQFKGRLTEADARGSDSRRSPRVRRAGTAEKPARAPAKQTVRKR